ncbi:MAG TPA: hypothetical protein VMX35_14245 [Acidobacteriota bacterium]|nr:hypothetical protein [Acidobacteriota bacterium]
MAEWIIIGSLLALAVVMLAVLIWLRFRSSVPTADEAGGQSASQYGVEYEWTTGSSPAFKIFLVLVFGAILVGSVVFFFIDEADFMDLLKTGGAAIAMVVGLLGGLFKKKTYQMTGEGLYGFRQGGKERTRMFAWPELLWFKPGNSGFKYYLRQNISQEISSGGVSLSVGKSIYCGKHATLVNSIIMARGIPTSPPMK